MNTRLLQFTILASLLATLVSSCALTDDAARYGDDLVRVATTYGDDIARQADDIGRTAQKSDDVVQHWDKILRASRFADDGARLIYTRSNLTPVQASVVDHLITEGKLADNEALLYLQGVCFAIGKLRDTNMLPSKSISQQYIEAVANQNDIALSWSEEYTISFLQFTEALIAENPETDQQAARMLFDGLCLVADL